MSFKNDFEIFIKNNLTNIKFSVSCCRVRGVFQAPQAACGRSVARHSLPEDAFKTPTRSVVISPSRSVPLVLIQKRKDSEGLKDVAFWNTRDLDIYHKSFHFVPQEPIRTQRSGRCLSYWLAWYHNFFFFLVL